MNRSLEQRIADAVREAVTISLSNPLWPSLFEGEMHNLQKILPNDIVLRYEHFGSTAVPGLAAKPIIDMLIEVSSLTLVQERIVPILELSGYEYFWRTDVSPPYAWFIKRDEAGQRTHHLHMVEGSSDLWERLLFRDYLRDHVSEAQRYAELKLSLAKKYPHDRIGYTQGKTKYITSVMQKARDFYAAT